MYIHKQHWQIWWIVVNLPKFYLPIILTNEIISFYIAHKIAKVCPAFFLPMLVLAAIYIHIKYPYMDTLAYLFINTTIIARPHIPQQGNKKTKVFFSKLPSPV